MKHIRRVTKIALAIFVAGLLLPALASAMPMDYIPLKFTGVSPGKSVYVRGAGKVNAGVYNLELGREGKPYDSFCIDFYQTAPKKGTFNKYKKTDLSHVFNEKIKKDIYQLWDNNYSKDMSSLQAAALQTALWEVTTSKYSKERYNVWKSNSRKGFALYANNIGKRVGRAATKMLNGLSMDYKIPKNLNLLALTSKYKQDFLVGHNAPVPEPATMLLMGAGLVGVITYGRRKAVKK